MYLNGALNFVENLWRCFVKYFCISRIQIEGHIFYESKLFLLVYNLQRLQAVTLSPKILKYYFPHKIYVLSSTSEK